MCCSRMIMSYCAFIIIPVFAVETSVFRAFLDQIYNFLGDEQFDNDRAEVRTFERSQKRRNFRLDLRSSDTLGRVTRPEIISTVP